MSGMISRPVVRAGTAPFLVLSLVLLGCQQQGAPAAAPPSESARQQTQPPRPVKLVAAVEETADRQVSATGTLAADEQVVLGTKVPGRVAELLVDMGSRVRAGQVIARLDQTDARLRVAQGEAGLQQARVRLGLPPDGTDDRVDPDRTALVRQARAVLDEAALTRERMQRLFEQQLIARAQLDAAVSALGVAEARYQDAVEEVRNRQAVLLERRSELAQARQVLKDTEVVSPVDGAVSVRQASVGEYLGAGAPVATVVKIHPLRLRLAIPEREAGGVRIGQPVVVTVEGAEGTHRGRVARISPSITEQSRTLMVEAEVPNAPGVLRPGSFAKGDIVVSNDVRVVTVPANAVTVFAGVEKVLTVEKNRAVEVRVQTARRRGDRVEIASGLAPGTPVVVDPGNLTAGQPVSVTP
jgi:RND family efflux transporter MFP subunit